MSTEDPTELEVENAASPATGAANDSSGHHAGSGEGAESALALLKRRQQARGLVQPRRELG